METKPASTVKRHSLRSCQLQPADARETRGTSIPAAMTAAGSRLRATFCPLSRLLACVLMILAFARSAIAGGGPENVFLVVNPLNQDSVTIANHYCQLRQIPASNIFYLDWDGDEFEIDISTFRTSFLTPIFAELAKRNLEPQIDYVVYSAGFPYAVDFSTEVPVATKFPKASLTGLTYLNEFLRQGSGLYTSLSSNHYMRNPNQALALPTSGFRAQYGLDILGRRQKEGGRKYMLSVMLGYTSGAHNNSLDEVLEYLERSAQADGTVPRGTIYFARNGDIRSRARHDLFPQTVTALQLLGVQAEIVEGVVPQDKPDVQGAMIGKARFNWGSSRSTILPGAICENFTSYGGALRGTTSQTLLAEFLRYGAAGSCGTVVEPFALRAKFPHPMLHAHYARGCTLAEAFYQSVHCPYQLLIVGDPLCRPWARIPTVTVGGLEAGQTVSSVVVIEPAAHSPAGPPVDRFDVFVDGLLATTCGPSETAEFDSRKLSDGYHELRVVAIEDSPIETQGRAIVPFFVNNDGREIDCSTSSSKVFSGQELIFAARSPQSSAILIFHNHRQIGRIDGPEGELKIDLNSLGTGPVQLQAVGIAADAEKKHVFAAPIVVDVQR